LEFLDRSLSLTLVVEDPADIEQELRRRYRVIAPAESDPLTLRLYHVGNSPLHGFIYREAVRTPGVVVLHEWNLHELLLGFAVTANDFVEYRGHLRREHGARGSVAAETIASALGGRYWTSVFPLNAEILGRALGVVCLSGSTAARVAARAPETPLLHLPHHALLKAHVTNRSEARARLGLDQGVPVVLIPGLETASKSIEVALGAIESIRRRIEGLVVVSVGGESRGATRPPAPHVRALGRVSLETLGDALLAADVILALRFPSRGEASGVVMRALAAGRAVIVSSGSTADEDLPEGVVARVNPGPAEVAELGALLEFLLEDETARLRLERLSLGVALSRPADAITERLSDFLREVAGLRREQESKMLSRASGAANLRARVRDDIEAAAMSLGLTRVPPNVLERLAGL
jgi:glycosyltransferase involved in cell wall biosynthesis